MDKSDEWVFPKGKDPNELLPPQVTADELGIEASTLAVWRCTGRYDLPYVKIGSRVKYRRADVQTFKERRRVCPGRI